MKQLARNILRKFLSIIDNNRPVNRKIDAILENTSYVGTANQMLLSLKYKELFCKGVLIPEFEDVEFKVFSQNGEDGILLYLFSLIGTTNRKAVEVCAGDGIECNTANLIVNHGWDALLFDGSEENIRRGQQFYSTCRTTFLWPPTLVKAWITAENVNSLIVDNGFEGEIDLLSLDLDGMDYWIWKAIHCIKPRVVVLEYNSLWGSEHAVTVPYQADFRAEYSKFGVDYGGASLPAFVKLGREKGYRLVGCQRYGFNAFFVRSGIGEDIFSEIPASKCFEHPFAQYAMSERLPKVIDFEWVRV
jgi:hypothetical protein